MNASKWPSGPPSARSRNARTCDGAWPVRPKRRDWRPYLKPSPNKRKPQATRQTRFAISWRVPEGACQTRRLRHFRHVANGRDSDRMSSAYGQENDEETVATQKANNRSETARGADAARSGKGHRGTGIHRTDPVPRHR